MIVVYNIWFKRFFPTNLQKQSSQLIRNHLMKCSMIDQNCILIYWTDDAERNSAAPLMLGQTTFPFYILLTSPQEPHLYRISPRDEKQVAHQVDRCQILASIIFIHQREILILYIIQYKVFCVRNKINICTIVLFVFCICINKSHLHKN